jgi:dUTP pyrophosphatase
MAIFMQEIKVELVNPEALIPVKANPTDAGYDISAPYPAEIEHGKITIIDTGFKVQIPNGFYLEIVPRSGLAARGGITVINSPGIIDPKYRDTVKVILTKLTPGIYTIDPHERIAQCILRKGLDYRFAKGEVDDDSRGGGLGSTGRSRPPRWG